LKIPNISYLPIWYDNIATNLEYEITNDISDEANTNKNKVKDYFDIDKFVKSQFSVDDSKSLLKEIEDRAIRDNSNVNLIFDKFLLLFGDKNKTGNFIDPSYNFRCTGPLRGFGYRIFAATEVMNINFANVTLNDIEEELTFYKMGLLILIRTMCLDISLNYYNYQYYESCMVYNIYNKTREE
jgi:hypothetical protein